ncbi:MAG: uracil-DNA glycosylase [Bacteroidia bacterium]|nr:uracil-DNA glycosylase [Bacteroidia bacterium]
MLNPIQEPGWKNLLHDIFKSEEFASIKRNLEQEYASGKTIFPPKVNIFQAFELCALSQVKVVIVGQDPYHGLGQAHGLSFSVQPEIAMPPSLKNIFKALKYDYPEFEIPSSGNLNAWAEQGVLLLNSVLTVREKEPGSHQKIGWQNFTDEVIRRISEHKENVVFMLWGNYAQSKMKLIDAQKHLVLCAPHPSPLSAHQGFITCKHFSACNAYLNEHQKEVLKW